MPGANYSCNFCGMDNHPESNFRRKEIQSQPRARRLASGRFPGETPKESQAEVPRPPPPPPEPATQANLDLAHSLATIISAFANSLGPVNLSIPFCNIR